MIKTENKHSPGLVVSFCGLELENPFILASGPPTRNAEMILKGFEAGWAGAVTKTISLSPTKNPRPRLAVTDRHNLFNIELISTDSAVIWSKWNKTIKRQAPDKILIASIMAAANTKDWQKLAKMTADSGADAIELNISCPHGMPEQGMGSLIGQNPILTGKIVKAVKKAVKIPVIAKLTPNVTDISIIARSCKEHGADALSGINTVKSLAGIDIETCLPLPNVKGKSTYGGYSGKGVKPIALRCISEMYHETKMPISAGGGIFNWQDALEFILAGASTIQICTAVMLSDYSLIHKLLTGTKDYLARHRVKHVADLVGLADRNIVRHSALAKINPKAVIRQDKCLRSKGIQCTKCHIACHDSAYQAISLHRNQFRVINQLCDGCGLCFFVCPAKAIRMK